MGNTKVCAPFVHPSDACQSASGTWIPLERGISLCQQYNCDNLLRPILEFQPEASDKSPPLAPKHLVAAPHVAKAAPARRAEQHASTPTVSTRSSRRAAVDVEDSERETFSVKGSDDDSMSSTPTELGSSSSRTPSPIRTSLSPAGSMAVDGKTGTPSSRKRKYAEDDEFYPEEVDALSYGDLILEYFISDTAAVPAVLLDPPRSFDPDIPIDDDGHTALHWACAMGRVRIVKLLLTAGASIFVTNRAGQTPLMRSVMFANNYDVRKFPEVYQLLHRSTLNIDNNNRTVFHHIVDVAMSKGKTHAARYYLETVLVHLRQYPNELTDIINWRDEDGETALTLAARCRSKRVVKMLIDHGADPKIRNRDGKSTEDYILEDERFRSSPIIPNRALAMSFRNAQAANPPAQSSAPNAANAPPSAAPLYGYAPSNGDRPPLHYSQTGQKAATRVLNDVTVLLDSLAASYDQELRDKERDTNQANAVLSSMQGEILESQRTVTSLRTQAQALPHAKERLAQLESELRAKMGQRYRLGWEKWIKDEEEREKNIRDISGGQLRAMMDGGVYRAANGEDITDLLALHSDLPTDPDAIRKQCEQLREELADRKKRRAGTFETLVQAQAEAGTGGRMSKYRRLIGAGCGGVSPDDVDSVVKMLLEV